MAWIEVRAKLVSSGLINGTCFCCSVVITGLTYNQFHVALQLQCCSSSWRVLLFPSLSWKKYWIVFCSSLSDRVSLLETTSHLTVVKTALEKRTFVLQMTAVSHSKVTFGCALEEFLIHLL